MTKDTFVNKYSGGFYGDQSSLEKKLAEIAKMVWENGAGEGLLTVTDDTTLTADDLGRTVCIATDAKTLTLPLITTAMLGKKITIMNTGADGNNIVTISPNAADGISGSIANAAADSVASGAVGKDFVNTKATANKGDYVVLMALAATSWVIVGGVGIWASES